MDKARKEVQKVFNAIRSEVNIGADEVDIVDVEARIKELDFFDDQFFFLFDFQNFKYVYFNDSAEKVMGLTLKEVQDMGVLEFFMAVVHPEDAPYCSYMIEQFMILTKDYDTEYLKNLRQIFTYRIKRYDGEYIRVIEQKSITKVSSTGGMLVSLSSVSLMPFGVKSVETTGAVIDISTGNQLLLFDQTNTEEGEKLSLTEKQHKGLVTSNYMKKEVLEESLRQHPWTILLVENDSERQEYIRKLFESDYNVITANTDNEGISLALEEVPDIIISSLLPDLAGLKLAKKLKNELSTSHIPIVLVDAIGGTQSRADGFHHGADIFIESPFDQEELVICASNLIAQREKLRRLFSKNIFLPAKEITISPVDQQFLDKATTLVEKNISDPEFTVEKLCKGLALNRNSVHQKLKALTGQSAVYFIRAIRLKKSIELLDKGSHSMIEIAELSGYNTRQAFNKAFKAQFEMTPSEYLKKA